MQQAKLDKITEALTSLSRASKFPILNEVVEEFKILFNEYRTNRTLYDTGKIVTSESDIDKLLTQAVDRMIQETNAERGMIILVDDKGNIEVALARNQFEKNIPCPEEEISKNIVQQVLLQQQAICVPDVQQSPQLRRKKSIMRLELIAVACVPIVFKKQLLGVIYVDNRSLKDIFNAQTVSFLKQFGELIAIAVDNVRMRLILERHNSSLEKMLRSQYKFEPFIGHHPSIIKIMDIVAQVADTDATVLIEGDTGTGKELVARALHFNSSRTKKELVAINCGALPENLLESELFGYVKGAFTGASSDKKGKFEFAHGGTIFLDEIGELHPRLQVKLLRILQSGEYSPVGSEETRHCNVRIIAATNRDLKSLVNEGNFRNDLYYRLNIIRLTLPRLVERRSDILVLANHFLENFRKKNNKPSLNFSRAAEQFLINYDFPGNVRELENIVERACLLAKGAAIEPGDLSDELRSGTEAGDWNQTISSLSFRDAKARVVADFERTYISHVLAEANGVIRQAARLAQMDVKNFHSKISKLGIQPGEFK